MTASSAQSLLDRDAAAVAGIEKLRFFPIAVESGKGAWLTEVGGRRLLDLSATWTACGLGHGHPRITETITRAAQAPAGAGGLSAVHPDSVGFAEELLAFTPGTGDRRAYFGHAGSDANEMIFRACRMATGKPRIVTFKLGYHGGFGISMGVSGVHVDAGAAPDPNVYFATYPNPFRPHAEGADPVRATLEASIAEIDAELAKGDVCVLMAEPILSDGGMILPPKGFLTALHDTCRKHDVLLAIDEVKMGLGRPGVNHAFMLDGIEPEIVTFGKVIGSGLPLSAAVAPAWVIDGPPASALITTAGNPICTAVGREVLRVLQEEDLPARAGRAGARFMAGLRDVMAESDVIGDVRGAGLAIGLELVTDRNSNTPDPTLATKVVYRAFELGAVVHYVGGNTLEITPPLIISDEEVDTAVSILAEAIADAAAGKVSDEAVAPYAGW